MCTYAKKNERHQHDDDDEDEEEEEKGIQMNMFSLWCPFVVSLSIIAMTVSD